MRNVAFMLSVKYELELVLQTEAFTVLEGLSHCLTCRSISMANSTLILNGIGVDLIITAYVLWHDWMTDKNAFNFNKCIQGVSQVIAFFHKT